MSLSLYTIEASLLELVRLREDAAGEGDSEALKEIDDSLREYLTAEAVKVTNYVSLIRDESATAEACERESERFADIARCKLANVARLKALALEAMQAFDVKELKATPGGGLRRQANGGIQALDVAPDAQVAPQYMKATVTMSRRLLRQFMEGLSEADCREVSAKEEPDTERIREALKQRIVCPECEGLKPLCLADSEAEENPEWFECQRCNGEGTIPNTIPGVKLLPRGEHVRVI